jgi:hypothetical protein
MINEGGSATPTDNTGKVKVTVADTLGYLWDKLSSDDGTVTLTKHTVNGVEHVDLSVGSIGGVAAIGDTYKVGARDSSSTPDYLGTVLTVTTGLTKTIGAHAVNLSFSGKLDDLSDVDGATAAAAGTILVKQTGVYNSGFVLLYTHGATDLGAAVTNQATQLVTREMVNKYLANLQFGGISGGTDYTASSMWRTRWISHMEMWFAKHTTNGSNTGFTGPVVSTDTRVVATDAGYVELNAVDTGIGIVSNGTPGVVAGHAIFNHPIEEDWDDTDVTPYLYVDLALSNDASAIAANVPCHIRLVAIALNNEEDITSATRIATVDETVTWLTAKGLARYLQYHTFAIPVAAPLTLAKGDLIRFDVSTELQAGQDPEVHILGARIRYKKRVVDIRIADSLEITNQ